MSRGGPDMNARLDGVSTPRGIDDPYVPGPVALLSRLSYVPRWTIVPMTRPQTVSDHVYRCLILVRDFVDSFPLESPELELDILRYILVHEKDEALTGDIPSTAKNGHLNDGGIVVCICRFIDTIEALAWFRMHHGAMVRGRWLDIHGSILTQVEKATDALAGHFNRANLVRWGNRMLEVME